jgi:hypothetical protein
MVTIKLIYIGKKMLSKNKGNLNNLNVRIGLFIVFLLLAVFSISASGLSEYVKVSAAPLTQALMRLDRMKTGINPIQNILIVAKPASTATEEKVRVVFNSSFSVNDTATNITISTANLPSELVASQTCYAMLTTSSVAAAVDNTTVDFSVANLDTTTTYCFFITNGVGNGAAGAGEYNHKIETLIAADALQDSADVSTRLIVNDQVTVTAVVPATFSFSLGATSTSFLADLSTSMVTSATAVSVNLATNAQNGWVAWLKSTSGALGSVTTGENILTSGAIDNAPMTLITGRDMYMLDVNINTDSATGDGTVTVDGEYNGTALQGGSYSSTALERLAYSNGTSNGDIIDLVAKATITAVKSAATDYTDLWTVVGAAEF